MKNNLKTSKLLRWVAAGAFGIMLVFNIMISLEFEKDKVLPSLTLTELGNGFFHPVSMIRPIFFFPHKGSTFTAKTCMVKTKTRSLLKYLNQRIFPVNNDQKENTTL